MMARAWQGLMALVSYMVEVPNKVVLRNMEGAGGRRKVAWWVQFDVIQ